MLVEKTKKYIKQRRIKRTTMLLFLSIFSLIIIACLVFQFYIVFSDARKTRLHGSNFVIHVSIKRKTDNVMSAIKTGKIKKHLLYRKNLGHDGGQVGKGSDFLYNNVSFDLPLGNEEKRYNG